MKKEWCVTEIVLAHRFYAPPGWRSYEYAGGRQMYGLVYGLRGWATNRFQDGRTQALHAGQAMLLPRGTTYVTACDERAPFEHMTVNFHLQAEDGELSQPLLLQPGAGSSFEYTFTQLVRCWTGRHSHYRVRCIGLLYELLYQCLAECTAAPRVQERKIAAARDYLDEHFCEDFPLSELPERCHMTETYFRRLFQQVYQQTPSQYRTRLRIAKSRDLLLDGRLSVNEIARLCGYEDAAYFSRVFKQATGACPTSFIKNVEE